MPQDGTTRALLEVADRRLYAAKAAGRNRTVAEDHAAA
jgi:PleD family two-component response regulator